MRDGQEGGFSKEVSLFAQKVLGRVQSRFLWCGNFKSLSAALAVVRCNDRCMDIREACVLRKSSAHCMGPRYEEDNLEIVMYRREQEVSHSQGRRHARVSRTEMAMIAQVLNAEVLILYGIHLERSNKSRCRE